LIVVKQFGLQRSGTNLLKALLEANFEGVRPLGLVLGDKHGPAEWQAISAWRFDPELRAKLDLNDEEVEEILDKAARRDLRFVFTTKNPISWVISYWRYQRVKNHAQPPELHWDLCETCLRAWRARVTQWLVFHQQLPGDRSIFLRYEDLLCQPSVCLHDIEQRFGLTRLHTELTTGFPQRTRRGTDAHHGEDLLIPDRPFDGSYYTERRYLAEYPEDLLRRVRARVETMTAEHPDLLPLVRLD
jgi:hypothetical protein